MLNGVGLLPDANTMGTFSHEYRVADLDMFVLTNTQRNTSISFLHQRQRKTQCKQWQNQPLHEKDHAILGIIVRSKQRNASQRLCGFHQHTAETLRGRSEREPLKKNRADGSTYVGEETVVAGCVRNRIVWWCVNKKMHFPSWPHESRDLLLLLNI